MEYKKCESCGEWAEYGMMDLFIGIGDVCSSCSKRLRSSHNPKEKSK